MSLPLIVFDKAPSRSTMRRFACAATRGSCVTITSVASLIAVSPEQQIEHMLAIYRIEISRRLIGKTIGGASINARAKATRCCSPPESCTG